MRCPSLFILAFVVSTPAFAALSGKTADGCSYRIINGQYLTSCENKPEGSDTVAQVSAAPVTSYGAVPIRTNLSPATRPAPTPPPAAAPAPEVSYSLSSENEGVYIDPVQENRLRKRREKALNATSVGVHVGSASLKEAGSTTGLGVSVGTMLDEHFGLELGYSYLKMDMKLGLANRSQSLPAVSSTSSSRNDANLTSHLITTEVQAYATDVLKRFRPYVAGGLGWKISELDEVSQASNGTAAGSSSFATSSAGGGSLSQSSLGATAGAGAKLRLGKNFQLGFTFRYFFPLFRQDSKLDRNVSFNNPSGTRLTRADDELTGGAQSQLLGGLSYSF